MHDGIVTWHDFIKQIRIADVAVDELDPVLRQPLDILPVAGIGERVQHGDVHIRVMVNHIVHEVGADEAASAGHKNVPG